MMVKVSRIVLVTCLYFVFASFLISGGQVTDRAELRKEVQAGSDIVLLKTSLQRYLEAGNLDSCRAVAGRLLLKVKEAGQADSGIISGSYYLIGIYYFLTRDYGESIRFFNLSLSSRGNVVSDGQSVKALYNLSVAYNTIGDYKMHEAYSLKAIDMGRKVYGESSPEMVSLYSSIIIASIELQDYDKAIAWSDLALGIASANGDSPSVMADLYNNLGVCYSRMADYAKARLYFEKAESMYITGHLEGSENYIILLNSMAITYEALGMKTQSDRYYEHGISLAVSSHYPGAYNMVNSYALILGARNEKSRGLSYLADALSMARIDLGENSHTYYEVLKNYADYLREFNIDLELSRTNFEKCLRYLESNPRDLILKGPVLTGYSQTLNAEGEHDKALKTIQSLLFGDDPAAGNKDLFSNPPAETIKPDRQSLLSLATKYRILWDMYRKSGDIPILKAASGTSSLIVSVLEKIRMNISEEQSRLLLGDKYRDSYINAIRDFNLLFEKTGDGSFLEKAFEYSEKSKVAGLLASARELKAAQLNIPENIAAMEQEARRDISLLNARIADERLKDHPDTSLSKRWSDNLLSATMKRDSLIRLFEREYPGYYEIKYNNSVAGLGEISQITGNNGNYINYIASDSVLYIFVVNRNTSRLLAVPADTSFYNDIKRFRKLLSMPDPSGNARKIFVDYQTIGYRLYTKLISPVREYLIPGRLMISPDNILSYLPFETLPTSLVHDDLIMFRNVPWLMQEFDISYTYSATFMTESLTRTGHRRAGHRLIAFAPDYGKSFSSGAGIPIPGADSIRLTELPFARKEAEFVTSVTGGRLFSGEEATESTYKSEAENINIIHLAMHTILNDREPMQSMLVFSPEHGKNNDGLLKTYEVYSIPLKADMVVLSSCNSGTGFLRSGEGIMSLARGFIQSGSRSVVMSMWEIEDRSGTEIVEMFYGNLRKGYSKSEALRRARISYLDKADQLRSHPYFWAALVIYGDTESLYHPWRWRIAAFLAAAMSAAIVYIYFRKRRYS